VYVDVNICIIYLFTLCGPFFNLLIHLKMDYLWYRYTREVLYHRGAVAPRYSRKPMLKKKKEKHFWKNSLVECPQKTISLAREDFLIIKRRP